MTLTDRVKIEIGLAKEDVDMGKLRISGYAEGEYTYDMMDVKISFEVHGKTSTNAVKEALRQCEEFLSIIVEDGFSMNDVRIDNDSIYQEHDEDVSEAVAERTIIIRLPFDIKYNNYFMTVIQEKNYDAQFDVERIMSNESEIDRELLKKAIEDSREKASFIAEAMGQSIKKIHTVEADRYGRSTMDYMCYECERPIIAPRSLKNSNDIKAPTTKKSKEVEVVWIIE